MSTHVFGPVISRRLGISLGIDLIPYKTCTYDCVYCECGPTTHLVDRRSTFFPEQEIISQLDRILSARPNLDYVTFAGSGEPTLSLSLGRVIDHLKSAHPGYRVAVLTNGSLCSRDDVVEDLGKADLVIPTLATTRQQTFERIHRTACLSIETIIQGLVAFRLRYAGECWLEVFLVPPLNTTEDELESLREAIYRIGPDRVQLNTLDRPGAEAWVAAVAGDDLERIASFMGEGGLEVDIVGRCRRRYVRPVLHDDVHDQIAGIIRRRPCTAEEIATLTGLHVGEVTKYLADQVAEGKAVVGHENRGLFYSCRRSAGDDVR